MKKSLESEKPLQAIPEACPNCGTKGKWWKVKEHLSHLSGWAMDLVKDTVVSCQHCTVFVEGRPKTTKTIKLTRSRKICTTRIVTPLLKRRSSFRIEGIHSPCCGTTEIIPLRENQYPEERAELEAKARATEQKKCKRKGVSGPQGQFLLYKCLCKKASLFGFLSYIELE